MRTTTTTIKLLCSKLILFLGSFFYFSPLLLVGLKGTTSNFLNFEVRGGDGVFHNFFAEEKKKEKKISCPPTYSSRARLRLAYRCQVTSTIAKQRHCEEMKNHFFFSRSPLRKSKDGKWGKCKPELRTKRGSLKSLKHFLLFFSSRFGCVACFLGFMC